LRQLAYHFKLVARSMRRDLGYSSVMLLSFALSVSLLVTALASYRRFDSSARLRFPGIYRVQGRHNPIEPLYQTGEGAEFASIINFFVSAKVGRAASASNIPSARTSSFVAVMMGGQPDRPAQPVPLRFCDIDLFGMFAVPFRHGGPWRPGPGASADVAVLNDHLNDRLFQGENSVGRTIVIEGRPLTIVGVLAPAPTAYRAWGFNPLPDGAELLVPASLADALQPMPAIMFPPSRPADWTALIAGPQRFMEIWVSIPDDGARALFATLLADVDPEVELVTADSLVARFFQNPPQYTVFVIFTAVLVVGNMLNAVRLMLAKALARAPELGIHRALGAPRSALFERQLLEGLLVVAGGATLGVALGIPAIRLFDALVPDMPTPLALDARTAGLAWLFALLLGLLAAAYPAWRVALVPPTRHMGRL
jgi:putative ABC transport system permease protein